MATSTSNTLQSINTFVSGINQDLDKSLLKGTMAHNIENFRLVTTEGKSTGALENVKGNALSQTIPDISNMYFITMNTVINPVSLFVIINGMSHPFTMPTNVIIDDLYDFINTIYHDVGAVHYIAGLELSLIDDTIVLYSTSTSLTLSILSSYINITTIPAQSNLKIIGYTNIRETTVLFTTNCVDENESVINSAGYGQIWKLDYDDTGVAPVPTLILLYNNLLAFSDYHLIEAQGRFETTDVRKVYWVDYHNYLRFCNIDQTDLMILPPSSLDMINDAVLSVPLLNSVVSGGIYKAGVVQYAYQLYNQFGAQTPFSACSNLIHLTLSDEWASLSGEYKGTEIGDDTGKAVKIDIYDIDDRFDSIKIVAIFWDTLNGAPDIRYIYDNDVTSNYELHFVDDGSVTYGALTADEFNSLGGALIIPKTLTTKYDYMFLGNIKEPSWDIDFDARAYRFDLFGNAIVNDSQGNTIAVDQSQTDWGIPLEHDAIAPFNNDIASSYKYQSTGGRFGGNGPNVSYKFGTRGLKIDTIGDPTSAIESWYTHTDNTKEDHLVNGYLYPNDSFNNTASPQVDGLIRSYQRDEVYRFALVFWNLKMKPSFAHWIADIRMPHQRDEESNIPYQRYAICQYDSVDDITYGINLYPEFTIDLSSLSANDLSNIESVSIVRMKREGNDRTVIANGMIAPAEYNGADSHDAPIMIWDLLNTDWNKDLYEFNSPEVNFNRNINHHADDYLDIIGLHSDTTFINNGGGIGASQWSYKAREITEYTNTNPNQYKWDTMDSVIPGVGFSPIYTVGGGNSYRNYIYDPGVPTGTYHGTTMLVKCDSSHYLTIGSHIMAAANYKRIVASQYGGNTYNARQNNEYIECVNIPYTGGVLSSIMTFNGDTFICMYDYLRFMWDEGIYSGGGSTCQEVNYFPVETSINLFLRHDTCFSKGGNSYMLQESKALGDTQWPLGVYPPDFTDLYLYNSVYSQENILKTFYPRPNNFHDVELHDVLLMSSQKKENGEDVDNWLTYLTNDRKEVDSNCGQLNKLLNWKNYIFFWQDRGFGMQSVLPRSLIIDNNGTELTLGSGTVLDRHDYISTEFGCRHQRGIASSKDSMVWYDVNKKKFFKYSEKASSLSDVKGLQSFFANNTVGNLLITDNTVHNAPLGLPISSSGVSCEYDDRYNEYLFSFCTVYNTGLHLAYTQKTIAYNDTIDAFTAFYSFDPALYIKTWNKLITTSKANAGELWLHNNGTYGSFYGALYDSTVDFYINDYYLYTKVFDSLEYLADVTLNDVSLLKEGFNRIRCSNSVQNSDWYDLHYYDATAISFNQLDVTRRESSWGLQLPRNAVLLALPSDPDIFTAANLDQTRPFRERLRDNFLFVNMIYQNANSLGAAKNYRIVVPYIRSNYRASIR